MTYNEDIIRLLNAQVFALTQRVKELEAKLEIQQEQLNYENR